MTRSGMEGVALDRRVSPVLVGREESQTKTKALRAAVHSRDAVHYTHLNKPTNTAVLLLVGSAIISHKV